MKLPTPDQLRGIETIDRSLLLSAAAGSGKTAVLARRCAHIVCRSEQGGSAACGVENLLVVTFTKAAAQQMRDRIAGELQNELAAAEAADDKPAAGRLRREIALLPRAAIGTLSSFCAGILRRHFQAARVDPQFSVLDDDQARLLKRQAARAVLNERYEQGEEAFLELVDLYAEGWDDRLINSLIACDALQTSLADPAQWRREAMEQVREAAERPLPESDLGQQLLALVVEETAELLREAERMKSEASELGLGAYAKHIETHMIAPAAEWAGLAAAGDLDGLCASVLRFCDSRTVSLPGVRQDSQTTPQLQLKDDVNSWRKQLRERDTGWLLRFSGAEWIEGMKRVVAPTEQFLALVEAFRGEYEREKASMRALDFADLERKALDLLLRDPSRPDRLDPSDIALYYQRQFHHVLVDEFQDINEVQARLLALLSRETAPEEQRAAWRNNLFAVGDVKQSIYRFRLAEPEMFMNRADQAEAAESAKSAHLGRVDLQVNFRSRAPLLEAVNAVFSRLMSDKALLDIDYAQKHALVHDPGYAPVPDRGFAGGPVELHVLEPQGYEAPGESEEESAGARAAQEALEEAREADRIEREATVVAERILAFKRDGRMVLGESGQPEPFTFRHAAVLLRSRKFNSEQFAGVLRRMEIPCFSEVGTGFFASLEVRDIVSLLHVLDNHRQDIPLAAVLRSPLVDLPDAEDVLARVRLMYRQKEIPFFEAVLRYAEFQDDAIAARLRYVLDQLAAWRRLAQRRPLAELLWQVYIETGYLAYVSGLHDGQQRVANLLELHRRAGQFDAFQRSGLGAFMQFLQSLEDAGEVGQPPVLTEADDVVRVMSIHAAKGLEFPVVFLPDCGKVHNLRDTYGQILFDRRMKLALQAVDKVKQIRYPSAVHELARRRIRRASLAEELRVLYVAMTRAREHLVCVGTAVKDAAREVERWRRGAGDQPLPSAEVLKGRSYLDWLGRAAACEPCFELRIVPARQIDPEARRYGGRARSKPVPDRLKALEPLESPPPRDEAAEAVVARLLTPYRFAAVARLRASAGVTSLESSAEPAIAKGLRGTRPRWSGPALLKPPAWVEATFLPSAADIGTATHLALRHLDFRDAAGEPAVRRQIDRMVARRQLSPALAAHIDAASLAWLAETELGDLLRKHHDRLLRELPVRVPASAAEVEPGWEGSTDGPLDRVLLRGQIDVVVPLEEGLIVADYKTDRMDAKDPAALDSLVQGVLARYRSQLVHYGRSLGQITGRPVTLSYLALLQPRRLERVLG